MCLLGEWYNLKKYRLCRRKSKPDSDFTLTLFVRSPYLQPFCPNCGRDGTPEGFRDAEFTSD